MPLLGAGDETPNFAILFRELGDAPATRRLRESGLLRGEAPAGVLLSLDDPGAARDALGELGVVRPLDTRDLHGVLHPGTPDAPGREELVARRWTLRGWGLVLLGLVVPVVALFGASVGWYLRDRRDWRRYALIAAGLTVFAVRMSLWLADSPRW